MGHMSDLEYFEPSRRGGEAPPIRRPQFESCDRVQEAVRGYLNETLLSEEEWDQFAALRDQTATRQRAWRPNLGRCGHVMLEQPRDAPIVGRIGLCGNGAAADRAHPERHRSRAPTIQRPLESEGAFFLLLNTSRRCRRAAKRSMNGWGATWLRFFV